MFYRQLHINWKSGKSSRGSNQYVPRHLNELYKLHSAEKHVCFCLQFFFLERCHGLWTVFFWNIGHGWVVAHKQPLGVGAKPRCPRCGLCWQEVGHEGGAAAWKKIGCHAISSLKLRVCTWKDLMPMIRRSGGSFLLGEGWHLFRCHQYFQWCNFCDPLTCDFPRLGRQLADFWGPQSLRFHDPIWLMKNH